jgi:hypothetical protein
MRVGGGLNYVTGPMGAGKSLYGVRAIVRHLLAGHYVVTNVELLPDAIPHIARRASRFTTTPAGRRKLEARLTERYVFTTELEEAMRYRLPGRGEARGLFVWDETHNDLNNRDWRKDGRETILKWSTQLRKLGFVGYLLSQHADNTDAALRRVCNFQVRLQNQREQTRAFGLRVSPWPLFLAMWLPTNTPLVSKVKPMKVERYFLDWHRHLYDTFGVFHGLDDDLGEGTILLGSPRAALARQGMAAREPTRRAAA